VTVTWQGRAVPWCRQRAFLRDAVVRLAHPGETEQGLAESVHRAGGPAALPHWYAFLQELARAGLLRIGAAEGPTRLATLVPVAPSFALPLAQPPAAGSHTLSRFAYARREGTRLALESPLSFARVLLEDERAGALVQVLAGPATAEEAARRAGLSGEAADGLLALLSAAGLTVPANEGGGNAEDADPALGTWEFHDLLFHARSREGRHDGPVGATYFHLGRLPPPPALKPLPAGEAIPLYRPDLGHCQAGDPPFAQVVERRRSIREYGEEPITDRQLGEFLYRVARVKERREVEVMTPHGLFRMEFTSRPYPGGGALYELEVYPVVNACGGLSAGLYYYDPEGHRLIAVAGRTPEVERLLFEAGGAAGVPLEKVQVVLVLAARFGRLAWKYSTVAYALTLKHVGVLYQTMYLTATAMGLAPCGVGAGNSDRFARAAGTAYAAETSVGEFLLGSRPREAG
jgi:SagB-type dehydrogenase family enzyme